MTKFKHPEDMTVPELCERFEKDIYNGLHKFPIEYWRSQARAELKKRGVAIIREIRMYREVPSERVTDGTPMSLNVVAAWKWFLDTINESPASAKAS